SKMRCISRSNTPGSSKTPRCTRNTPSAGRSSINSASLSCSMAFPPDSRLQPGAALDNHLYEVRPRRIEGGSQGLIQGFGQVDPGRLQALSAGQGAEVD